MENMLGRMLEDRYLIEELIGVGGMANVYKAYDTCQQRPVAVKMLRDEYARSEEFLRRFRNESKAITSLNHPCIVKVYDVLLELDNPAIVMEFVEGITLKEYIERKGRVNYRVAVALTAQILSALEHAHQNGIVHRDIKPQNIIVRRDGSIKVMDFGIARVATSQSRTLTDRAIGSVHYISPEQALGGAPIDCRADLYSTGVMLFEMLTGRLPFEADSPVSVAIKQIEDKPLRPTEICPDLPKGLDDITLRAMAKSPADRYQTAGQMLGDLERFVDDPNIVFGYARKLDCVSARSRTQQPTVSEPASRPAARKSTASGILGSIGAKGKPRTTGKSSEAPKTAASAQQRKTRKKSGLAVLYGVTAAVFVFGMIFIGVMLYNCGFFTRVEEVDMPNLVGLSYDEIRNSSEYKKLNFEFVIESQEFNAKYPQGVVFAQSPTSGKKVKEGAKVSLKVSTGAQSVTLTDFTNNEATLVYAKLNEMGLDYNPVEEISSVIPEGYVIRTYPARGEVVSAGTEITVYVSKGSGKAKVIVPDVTGNYVERARYTLEEEGFLVQVREEVSYVDEGTVLDQTPRYPAQVDEGSTISLTVAVETPSDDDEMVIFVWMPENVEEEMLLTVEMDGEEVYSAVVLPSAQPQVKVSLTGTGTSEVCSYLNGRLLQVNEVDFEEGTSPRIEDHTSDFE